MTSVSLRAVQPLTLNKILDLAGSATTENLAEFLHDELPVRFAQRIRMLEDLPAWQSKVSIASVRQMYMTSFKELRLADPREPAQFQAQLRNIKERHEQTNLLVGGFRAYTAAQELTDSEIDDWLERFFSLRISTNMLMSHYLQMSKSQARSIDPCTLGMETDYSLYLSSIDPKCNAARIARHAAHLVGDMARGRYGNAPRIEVTDNGSEAFPFVPRYMLYILSELLKNAVRATVETHCSASCQTIEPDEVDKIPPITVLVSGDENVCCFRVSDEGGGIPKDMIPKVWSYLFSTADPVVKPLTRLAVDAPPDPRVMHREASPSSEDEVQSVLFKSPLAGLGCGLPLSRLYARYLGGSIELQSLPRYGSDIFIYLNRLGNSSETLLSHN